MTRDQDKIDTVEIDPIKSSVHDAADKLRSLAHRLDDAVAGPSSEEEIRRMCLLIRRSGKELRELARSIERHIGGGDG